MSDKANWVGTTEVDDTVVQHQETHRFLGGSKFVIADPTDSTKTMVFNLSGLTTGTETEFTVPESDSSIVTLSATQTLTNKTLTAPTLNGGTWVATDSTFTIADNATPSKLLAFQCSGITAATTRTLTVPDASGTIALTSGSTLSSTTLSSPILTGTTTGTDIAVTSTGDLDLTASGATGDITLTAGRNFDLISGTAGYINLQTADGDVTLQTSGAADDIILSSASNGGTVYINSALRLDRQAQAGTGSGTFKTIIGVTDTSADVAITIPAAVNVSGSIFIVKDETGAANTHNITITPASGTIDGAANKVISTDYGVFRLYGDGTNWFTW